MYEHEKIEAKCYKTYLNISEHIQTYLNIFKHIQTHTNISEHIQTHPNIYKHIPTYPNISDFWTCPNISELNATISAQVVSLIVLKKDMIKETNLLLYAFDYAQKYCRYVIGTPTYTIKSVLV